MEIAKLHLEFVCSALGGTKSGVAQKMRTSAWKFA
jgi:hypothetical protein